MFKVTFKLIIVYKLPYCRTKFSFINDNITYYDKVKGSPEYFHLAGDSTTIYEDSINLLSDGETNFLSIYEVNESESLYIPDNIKKLYCGFIDYYNKYGDKFDENNLCVISIREICKFM